VRIIEDVVNSSQDFIRVTPQSKLQVDVIAKTYHPNLYFSGTNIWCQFLRNRLTWRSKYALSLRKTSFIMNLKIFQQFT